MFSLRSNIAEVSIMLIENGAEINTTNSQLYTPLHYAARYSSAAVVQLLLELGVDPDAVNAYNKKPINLVKTSDEEWEEKVSLLLGD